jgi:ribosomal protein S18 acetylase RimI-like enzyme
MTLKDSEQIIGTVVMRERLALPSRNWRLHGVFVAPEFRGNGLGRELITHALREARKNSARNVDLKVARDNVHAVNLYKRYGFTFAKETKGVATYVITDWQNVPAQGESPR